MTLSHPFEAADPLARRCEHLTDEGATVCGLPRGQHTRTADAAGRGRRQPIHPRSEDRYEAVTSVPGIDVAVDAGGCLVLHVQMAGAHTISNLDSFVAELELARVQAKRVERERADLDAPRHPGFWSARKVTALPCRSNVTGNHQYEPFRQYDDAVPANALCWRYDTDEVHAGSFAVLACCAEFARTGSAHTEVCVDVADDPRVS